MLETGSLVDGKYKILSEIGHGGMSVVYMAINEKANKTWAIKEVRKDGVLDFEAVKQGLIVETDMLKKLKHPNLPSIVDVIENEDTFLIVMDYIEGNSLSKALEEYGAQPQEYVIEWAKQLCDVLGYLHTREPAIIYRDLKPANIMLKPDGNLTLIDFGTAREFKEKNLADTTCLGTIGYAAPEQFGGMGQTDGRTDIYCLGATLYHLVTGRNPSEPPYEMYPIREINPSLSGGLERIILKCTQRNPEDRYQSTAELMYDLHHYEEIDDAYKKKQKNKLKLFFVPLILSIVSLIAGVGFDLYASELATDTYDAKLEEASIATDYEDKRKLYKECIAIPGKAGDKRAYEGLIQAYKFNDDADNLKYFDTTESQEISGLITDNTVELKKNMNDYRDLCYEIAKLYWFNYDYGNTERTRFVSAITWFQRALEDAPADYKNRGMAEVYMNLGVFFRDVEDLSNKAEDKGIYKECLNTLSTLIDTVAVSENENELVKVELLSTTRFVINKYATKLKIDGVTEKELNSILDNVESITKSINVSGDKAVDKKADILSNMAIARESVKLAYGTKKGVK